MKDNDLQEDIIALYDNNLKNVFSINQIARLLKKPYPYINKKVSKMIDNGILNKLQIGRSYLCSLNLSNEKTLLLLTLLELRKKEKLSREERGKLDDLVQLLKKEVILLSLVGTLINNKLQEIFVIAQDFKSIKSPIKLTPITQDQLEQLLINKSHPLYSNHVILYGAERFFDCIKDMEDELQKTYSPLFM